MKTRIGGLACAALVFVVATSPTLATEFETATAYPRAGWKAKLSTLQHGVSGTAEILDERTIVLRNFNYDGGGPSVYAYLAPVNTNAAFETGVATVQRLNRAGVPYVNETITVTLPATATLDSYTAISIWCADFRVNFGSGIFRGSTFVPLLSRDALNTPES
jgi:hypothetical protein